MFISLSLIPNNQVLKITSNLLVLFLWLFQVKSMRQAHGKLSLNFVSIFIAKLHGFLLFMHNTFILYKWAYSILNWNGGIFVWIFKEAVCEDPQYGIVENEGDYETAVTFENGASNLYAFRLHMGHPSDLHHGGGSTYGFHDLRLGWTTLPRKVKFLFRTLKESVSRIEHLWSLLCALCLQATIFLVEYWLCGVFFHLEIL